MELANLTRFIVEHEADFIASQVVSPHADGGVVNYEHRRSRVLMDLGEQQDVMLKRIQSVLPQVLEKLGMEEFSIADVEAQITASNDGDFFHFHSDNGSERVASRHLTFVYFFHREPRQFEGGELRIHDCATGAWNVRQRRHLPDDRSATEPNRLFPVRNAARNHTGEVRFAALRRQPLYPKRMASSINNPAWVEWMTTLMGAGVSRHTYAATLPPDRFYCLLDELPLHLIPQRVCKSLRTSIRIQHKSLVLNPDCALCSDGQFPDELKSRRELLSGFALQGTIAWVRNGASGGLLPFWLGPGLEKRGASFSTK